MKAEVDAVGCDGLLMAAGGAVFDVLAVVAAAGAEVVVLGEAASALGAVGVDGGGFSVGDEVVILPAKQLAGAVFGGGYGRFWQ